MYFLSASIGFKRYLAFTLAEVLIVLGIIGIVAEITLPTLVQSTQKTATIAQLKEFYSSFNQALSTYMQSQGCSDMNCTGIFAGTAAQGSNATAIDTAMKSVLKINKTCLYNASGCDAMFSTPLKYIDKSSANSFLQYGHAFATANGAIFAILDSTSGANECGTTSKGSCGNVYVDLNGAKGPNVWGMDIFDFVITNSGLLYPQYSKNYSAGWDWRDTPGACGEAGSTAIVSGEIGDCSGRIMDNGWVIDYYGNSGPSSPPAGT